MVLKLKHELGIGDLILLEIRRGCRGIPKLVVLLVLALFFFLIRSCFYSKQKKYFHLYDFLGSCKRVSFSKQKTIIVSPKMQAPQIIKKPP
jgi:hypothetical protein